MVPSTKNTKETIQAESQKEKPNLIAPQEIPEQIDTAKSPNTTEEFFEQPTAVENAIPRPVSESQQELPPQREMGIEKKGDGFLDETIEKLKNTLRRSKKKKNTQIPQVRDELTVKVEQIMEEGLKEAFQELTLIQKQEFKIKGEETALKIRAILSTARVKIKKIFQLILEWLKFLPGINRHFLEQEAKIKTDRIMALKEQMKKD